MPKKILFCLAIVSFIVILGSVALLFADSVWTGSGSTNNWSEAANWDTNKVPQAADSVIFDGTGQKDSYIDADFGGTIASITINDGYITGRIWQKRSLIITGDYTQSSGSFISPPNFPFSVGGSFSVSVPVPNSTTNPVCFGRFTGNGTVNDPTLVYDVYGLQCMPDGAALFYKLNNNIDASGTVNWREGRGFSPVGGTTEGGSFFHSVDGDGHTISNLYINITDPSQTNVGLFGFTYGAIKNIGMVNCSITGPASIEGSNATSAGIGSITGYNYGTITNCYNTGSVSGGESIWVGGLAGANGGTVSNCYNTGSVSGSVSCKSGGLVGQNFLSGKISNCYNIGNISGDSAGGLVGNCNFGTIEYSYNAGSVSSPGWAGGLVLMNRGTITNCYNVGTVSQTNARDGNGFVGGLVAWNFSGAATISNSYNAGSVYGDGKVGGVVGWLMYGTITNTYNIGTVSPQLYAGSVVSGFVGSITYGGTLTNCGWWTGSTGSVYPQLTYNESDRNAFTNPSHGVYTAGTTTWNFSSIWDMYATSSFPFFRWQVPSAAWTLNMTEMDWYQNTAPYNSTGAAACQMILSYIRSAVIPVPAVLTQDGIYEYGKSPAAYGPEMTPNEVDKALGHFDPYDSLVSNWADTYDSLPDGNPYQGYNYSVDTYDPRTDSDAINKYMRDICHWMAYSVTKEFWWNNGELVARPNTPAAIPIYGSYASWVAVKGCATSANPCPEPHTNPWNTPDFTVYGFWMKDPRVNGIGQNTFKTAAECRATYFLPLVTSDAYNGLFLQVAEPPAEMSQAIVEIPQPAADPANLAFIGVVTVEKGTAPFSNESNILSEKGAVPLSSLAAAPAKMSMASKEISKPLVKKQSWRDLVDKHLLTDPEAVAAFEGTKMGKSLFVQRTDGGADYYLAPFCKRVKGKSLVSAVMILDASAGYFREASWTDKPAGELLKLSEKSARRLIGNKIKENLLKELKAIPKKPAKNYLAREKELAWKRILLLRDLNDADAVLAWEPNGYSPSPYRPYWKIDLNGQLWYVTQEMKVIGK
jgi:hypothetical protein